MTKKPSKARKVLQKPQILGWKTSDSDEIELRRWRGRTEIGRIEALEPKLGPYGTFRVCSSGGGPYEVEIRDLKGRTNSCGCADHRVNGLGTCKHIEGVLFALRKKLGARAFAAAAAPGSPPVEAFLRRDGEPVPSLAGSAPSEEALAFLHPFLDVDGKLDAAHDAVARLLEAAPHAPAGVRISRHFRPWIERQRRLAARETAREKFLAAVGAGRASFDVVKLPLLPYQREGAAHLAFHERALLADEMGLGKTVQAIAACEILAREKGIERVLVVSPTSVKAEWEDQIARFTSRAARFVAGPYQERLALYEAPAFFTLVNYEQVVRDADDINRLLKPDVVILDEAQRIKNWHTKTARRVKSLVSPYAFVLTGTPLENRIDETYSIVQYLDPEIFGPLFRFNRDFYQLDERGRPDGYRNLDELHRRLKGVMLRRRKRDVEDELPGRTQKTFFVPMAEEQAKRYADYEYLARRLIALAQRRLLTKEEFDRLQQYLACMRMICDTPAILDPDCRVSPKLEELEGVLGELLEEPQRKIVVFSEWVRMLELARELAAEMGVDCAWHTGDVPQLKRRAEIARFREDPACRLFLSSDAGATGLNLQMANAVINLDLPWNPAKLEQRIARAWRKGQKSAVTVVNFVTEGSIEHSILHLLSAKQTLADGVLDGAEDYSKIAMPSGRAAMVERMRAMLGSGQPIRIKTLPPEEALTEDLKARHGARFLHAELRAQHLFLVLDAEPQLIAAERVRLASSTPATEILDRAAWETLNRLAEAGLIGFTEARARILHASEGSGANGGAGQRRAGFDSAARAA
ncbi:MAG: DEAD/DEAH box helicase [Hyphomicrobiales bacterium]|nr:DEAD/DEAH box helicase [Hyphomicrobiales bacterium]